MRQAFLWCQSKENGDGRSARTVGNEFYVARTIRILRHHSELVSLTLLQLGHHKLFGILRDKVAHSLPLTNLVVELLNCITAELEMLLDSKLKGWN